MRPFFSYFGSAWTKAKHLPIPKHLLVCEPFAGSAGYSVFYDCPRVNLIDKNPIICGVWRYLLSVTPDEIMGLPDMMQEGDSVDNYNIPQEAKWLIGFWLGKGNSYPKKIRTKRSLGYYKGQITWGITAKTRIASQLSGITGWSITEASYEVTPKIECTWLVDPPYIDAGTAYKTKFNDYTGLANWCRSLPGKVIVLEGRDANWLPFIIMGDFRTSRKYAQERIWENDLDGIVTSNRLIDRPKGFFY